MAFVELRFEGANVLEELPPVCLYCGDPVRRFTRIEARETTVQLPLCRDHTHRVRDVQDDLLDTLERLACMPGAIGLAGMVAHAAVQQDRQNCPTLRLDGVDSEFVHELMRIRRRTAREWERKLVEGQPDPKRQKKADATNSAFAGLTADEQHQSPLERRKHRSRGVPPWLIAVFVAAGLALAGVVLTVVIYGFRK